MKRVGERIIETIGEVIEERQFYPTYPEPNLSIHLWQIMQKGIGDLDEPLCWACNWYINFPLSQKKIKALAHTAYDWIEENFGKVIKEDVEKRDERRLPEFERWGKYYLCRWDLFWLIKIELKKVILVNNFHIENLREKLLEFTKRFVALYNWTLPKGGAGGNVW